MKNKIKNWWQGLKYWQKGFYIGLIFTIISFFGPELFPSLRILSVPYALSLYLAFGGGGGLLGTIFIFISPIFYILLGTLIGLIIGKIKKK